MANSDPARTDSDKLDSGFHSQGHLIYALRHHDRLTSLRGPESLIGRSTECDIIVKSALASRRHAKLVVTEYGLQVEDLQSRNGVLVNGIPISGPKALVAGDILGIGEEMLEVVELDRNDRGERQTITDLAVTSVASEDFDDSDKSLATRRADALQLLGTVVDKALALGQGAEAERLLAGHLSAALHEAKSQTEMAPEFTESAASYALKLARAMQKPQWIDYTIELYRSLQATLPLALVDELYELLRKLRPINRNLLRGYIADLKYLESQLSPAERFALKRIQGLERLADL